LLNVPKIHQIDAIYASLHTTKDSVFKKDLGVSGADLVMKNILRLKDHGYNVQINYSHGAYNKDSLSDVLDWVIKNEIGFKAITLIRSTEEKEQYGENQEWDNPEFVANTIKEKGLKESGAREGFGGKVKSFTKEGTNYKIEVKNIGNGRLRTDYCNGCSHQKTCGEGIYALRSGPDGLNFFF
jgi:molybdenum cofactor biosynthesis enzyme MoaA